MNIKTIKNYYNFSIAKLCLYFLIESSFFFGIFFAVLKLSSMAFGFPLEIDYVIGLGVVLIICWVYTYKYNHQFIDWFLFFFLSDFYSSYVRKLAENYKQISKEYPFIFLGFFLSYFTVCVLYFLNLYVFKTDPELLKTLFLVYNLYYVFRCFFFMPLYIWLFITNHPQFPLLLEDFSSRNPSFFMEEALDKTAIRVVETAADVLIDGMKKNPTKALKVVAGVATAGLAYQASTSHVEGQKKSIDNADKIVGEAKITFGIPEGEVPKELGEPAAAYFKSRLDATNTYDKVFRGTTSDGASFVTGQKTKATQLEENSYTFIDKMKEYHYHKSTLTPSEKPSGIPPEIISEVPSEVPTIAPSEVPTVAPSEVPTVAPFAGPNMPKEDSFLDLIISFIEKFIF